MRLQILLLTAGLLAACEDPPALAPETPPPAAPVPTSTPNPESGQVTASWSRLSSGEGEALRLEAEAELVALLVCRADGSGLHAATDRFQPVMSEERFTIGAGDEAFTLVADLTAERPRGVQASGEIPSGFIDRVEAGQPVSFNYGAQTLGPLPSIPEADARAFAGACRDIAR